MADHYTDADIVQYLDREAIRDVMYRYARGIDRCDPELLKTVYWPEGIDDHGDFVGKRDEFIAWVMPTLKNSMSVTQHFMGNILIRLEGNIAKVETYFQAFHRWEKPPRGKSPEDLVIAGRYLDRMEKRGKEWRVIHRVVAFDYFREYPDSADWGNSKYLNPNRVLGLRHPDDASCELFKESLARPPI